MFRRGALKLTDFLLPIVKVLLWLLSRLTGWLGSWPKTIEWEIPRWDQHLKPQPQNKMRNVHGRPSRRGGQERNIKLENSNQYFPDSCFSFFVCVCVCVCVWVSLKTNLDWFPPQDNAWSFFSDAQTHWAHKLFWYLSPWDRWQCCAQIGKRTTLNSIHFTLQTKPHR